MSETVDQAYTAQLLSALLNAQPHERCVPCSLPQIQRWLQHGADATYVMPDGRSLLELAITAYEGNTNSRGVVLELTRNGADPKHKTADGEPLVCYAARLKQRTLALQLVNSGADIHATDKNGWNISCYSYVPVEITPLITRGIDLTHCDNEGRNLAEIWQFRHEQGLLNANEERYFLRTVERLTLHIEAEHAFRKTMFNYTDFAARYGEICAEGNPDKISAYHDAYPLIVKQATESGALGLDQLLAPENLPTLQAMLRSATVSEETGAYVLNQYKAENRKFDMGELARISCAVAQPNQAECASPYSAGMMKPFGTHLREHSSWREVGPWYLSLPEDIRSDVHSMGFSRNDAIIMRQQWMKSSALAELTLSEVLKLDPLLIEDMKEGGEWHRLRAEKSAELNSSKTTRMGGRA